MYYKVLQHLTRVEIQKDTGDFRLLDRRCVNALRKLRESQRNTKSMVLAGLVTRKRKYCMIEIQE